MRDGPPEDYYALLMVARTATVAELRRSYRLLALRYHPDRAGEAGTETFQRIARAYAVLSDADSRVAYDRMSDRRWVGHTSPPGRGGGGGAGSNGHGGWGGQISWRVGGRAVPIPDLLPRLSGRLDDLLARQVARRCDDGTVELVLRPAEAISGGTAVLDASLPVVCPTCGGCAQRYVLWCRRCEYVGSIVDEVSLRLEIPPWVSDRTTFSFGDAAGFSTPLRLRLRMR